MRKIEKVNDGMGTYVAQRVVKMLARRDQPIRHARVEILGFTFKENVPDIRNFEFVDI
jgi:UDP-N-acetyl-D-galactosamine dehydrogenase